MIILGITHPICRNSAACLIKNGKLVAFVEEERFNGIKHSPYLPPVKSIEYCLEVSKIALSDVDHIAIGFDTFWNVAGSGLIDKALTFLKRADLQTLDFKNKQVKKSSLPMMFLNYVSDYYQGIPRLPFSISDPRVKFVRHHTAHCASAYYVSGFDEACILSVDGGGGQEAGMLAVGEGDEIRVIKKIPTACSLGYLYSTITGLLGFRRHDGEGKVMGLAAYGDPKVKLLPFVSFKEGIAHIDLKEMRCYLEKIQRKLDKNPLNKVNANLAASLQKTIEEAYIYMARYLYNKTGITNFCLAGGVSLNCLANTKVSTLDFVDKLFVQPANHDAGTALGAALEIWVKENGKRPGFVMEHAYYGPRFSNREIETALKNAEVHHYKKIDEIEKYTAGLLSKGKLIGWFQGRLEVGPRALGNRSILANPSLPDVKDIINKRVKGRETWRPFCPSMLAKYANDYLKDVDSSPFMILESRVVDSKLKEIISATHVDGTARPQTVTKKANPRYWKLIDEFRKITGIPVVLNTSFNIAGEPIVRTPQDALSTYFRCGLDYLVMGNFVVSKLPF
ncbi:hypothetical protein KKB40_02360 [Patescibacteria group bacterium]|nr:hypothetical protein [Patescibacteria group bacterium]